MPRRVEMIMRAGSWYGRGCRSSVSLVSLQPLAHDMQDKAGDPVQAGKDPA
jgi:hypothetical protein